MGPLGITDARAPLARPGSRSCGTALARGCAGSISAAAMPAKCSAVALTRVDLCWSAVAGLSMIRADPQAPIFKPGGCCWP